MWLAGRFSEDMLEEEALAIVMWELVVHEGVFSSLMNLTYVRCIEVERCDIYREVSELRGGRLD